MNNLIWLFPLLFLLHELEEIIGFEKWYDNNKNRLDKYPKIAGRVSKVFRYYTTKGMLFAILQQFALCVLVCLIAIKYDFYLLWLGAFIGYTIHLMIHCFQSILLRVYVPALITSTVEIPICFYMIYTVFNIYRFSLTEVVYYAAIGVLVIVVNLYFVHAIMKRIGVLKVIDENKIQ